MDVLGIVKLFGGRRELARGLKDHGIIEISQFAVNKWCERGEIPAARIPDLQALARKKRITFHAKKPVSRVDSAPSSHGAKTKPGSLLEAVRQAANS